jgi:trk system potassium uptake protein
MIFRKPRKQKEFAVIGLGMFGGSVAQTLADHGHYVLGIDIDEGIVQNMAELLPQVVCLDATNEDALQAVDIRSFDTAVVCMGENFESNLMTTVTLKSLGVQHIICKALTRRKESILLKVGADRVILPENEAGKRLAQELILPWFADQKELGPDHSIVELDVPDLLVGKSMAEAAIRREYGITILVIKEDNGNFIVSPSGEYILSQNERLIVLGSHQQIDHFSKLV